MSTSGRTPPTRKERRAAERATHRSPASAAPTPPWRSPVVLLSLGAVAVGVALIAVLALGSMNQESAPIRDVPGEIPVALRDGRSLGTATAPVVIDVWEDPQCPVCGRFSREIEPLLVASFIEDGTVRLNYRDLVFIGPESLDAAVGMRAADQLDDRFWDFNAIVYENQDGENEGAFARPRLGDMAEHIGLDRAAFLALLDDPALIAAVQDETALGSSMGIDSTPTLVVNGEIRPGLPEWTELSALIEAEAAAAASPTPGPEASAGPEVSVAP